MDFPVRNDSGFTLIELLIALVISGILAGSIFQVIKGESIFVRMHSAQEEVQQNSRGALELIGSELRAVPPGGLETAEPDGLTVHAPRVWGLVCAAPSGGVITVVLPEVAGLNYTPTSGSGLAAYVTADSAWTSASATVTAVGPAATDCGGQPVAPGSVARTFSVASMATTAAGTAPAVGDPVYFFDRVSYELATSSRPGLWIRRKIGTGSFEPLAGPIAEDGLKFIYCCNSVGANFSSAAPLTPAERDSTTRIAIIVEAESHSTVNGIAQTEGDTTTVYLRNRLASW
ncbi:MAG TPA: type II secretion system protein [Longimicrobiaceae bacterium]|nr:type II secretion system protein [Longimicrobiaceae bacterium]